MGFSLMRTTFLLFFMLQQVNSDHSWDCSPGTRSLYPTLQQLWNHYMLAYIKVLSSTDQKKHSVVLRVLLLHFLTSTSLLLCPLMLLIMGSVLCCLKHTQTTQNAWLHLHPELSALLSTNTLQLRKKLSAVCGLWRNGELICGAAELLSAQTTKLWQLSWLPELPTAGHAARWTARLLIFQVHRTTLLTAFPFHHCLLNLMLWMWNLNLWRCFLPATCRLFLLMILLLLLLPALNSMLFTHILLMAGLPLLLPWASLSTHITNCEMNWLCKVIMFSEALDSSLQSRSFIPWLLLLTKDMKASWEPNSASARSAGGQVWMSSLTHRSKSVICASIQKYCFSAAPLQPVKFPSEPWEKLGLDVVDPFETAGPDFHYALTLTDYHSKGLRLPLHLLLLECLAD